MRTSKPLVSVLISAYNHESFVEETINSIIQQTYPNIELLILDDGSKDKTWQKIQGMKAACEQRFVRIFMETQKNCGTCLSFNRLINEARGEYFLLIASDDVAKPQTIEKELSFLEKHPDYVLVVGDNEIIDSNSIRIGWGKHRVTTSLEKATYKTFGSLLRKNRRDVDFSSENFGAYETLVSGNYIPNGCLIRTMAVRLFGGFSPEAPLEDWYLHLQLSKLGKFKYLDEILLSYRWHENNTIKRAEYIKRIVQKTRLYEHSLVQQCGNEQWKEIFEAAYNQIKVKFKLGRFLRYYKRFALDCRESVLEVCGWQLVIKRKIF